MKMHVFFTDDDRDELKIFLEAMAPIMQSFKCTYATEGEQAIEMLKYLTPDLIFVDVNLPGINGLRVLEATKRSDRLRDIPFFVYSVHITDEIRKEAMELGAAGCIQKGDTIQELTDTLREALEPVLHVHV